MMNLEHDGKLLGMLLERSQDLQGLALEAASVDEAAEVLTDLHLAFWNYLKSQAVLSEDPNNLFAMQTSNRSKYRLQNNLGKLERCLDQVRVDGLRRKFG